MARFRGTVRGGRGEGTRLGHKTTGLKTVAKGWGGEVHVRLFVVKSPKGSDEDWANVWIEMSGVPHNLYHGPLNRFVDPRGKRLLIEE